jgi:molecular chaperone DnaK (HSP70)
MSARYLVGIDLGTTHTAVAYADLSKGGRVHIQPFAIDQLIGPGSVAARPLLPSLRYHPAAGELAEADTRLPWPRPALCGDPVPGAVLGEWARLLGAKSHGRLVSSAKSWLCHGAVDREAAILPWGAPEGVDKISPLDASASYLAEVRAAWSGRFPDDPLERQELAITVPASFDEAARALTVEAARRAGLPHFRLLEEPQAACYDWLWRNRRRLAEELADARLLLVVDVGGGTTDLTLIRVAHDAEEGPILTRVAVGNHLLLGGDNMDLALAHRVEQQIAGESRRLAAAELGQLVAQCRTVKERLLAGNAPSSATVTLLGSGARLIGGARSAELTREAVHSLVLEGFLPLSGLDDPPERKRSGVVEFGLPYAADAAISRHLAAFLTQHQAASREALGETQGPAVADALLLNGGLFRSRLLGERVVELLSRWRGAPPRLLDNPHPDQAVALGAVAFLLAHRGVLRAIGGGSARSYFLHVEAKQGAGKPGVCLLPRGSAEGKELILDGQIFSLRLGQPVRFHLLSTVEDTPWRAGELADLSDAERFPSLPPLAAAFDPREAQGAREVTVRLVAQLTELGTLRLQCVAVDDPTRRWDVEFQLRGGGGQNLLEESRLHPRAGEAVELIERIYGKRGSVDAPAVKRLRSELQKPLGPREDWDVPLLRELFAALLEGLPRRRRSADHERLWLSLAGFCLRPGFGYPLDDWRIEQVWAIYPQGIQFSGEAQNWAEWWIFWRRLAGGLDAAAQERLFNDIAALLNPQAPRGPLSLMQRKSSYEDLAKLAAVLERLPSARKLELGGWLLQRLAKGGEAGENAWALGRVGARVPFHGSAHEVVPRATAESWVEALLALDWKKTPALGFSAALIARLSGDRERDLDAGLRQRVLDQLRGCKAPEGWARLITEVAELEAAERKRVFGESLPPGLKLLD